MRTGQEKYCSVHELCSACARKLFFHARLLDFFFKSTIIYLILSFDGVTLQFVVWHVYFCVLKHIKFKFYENLTSYILLLQ